MVQEIKIHEDRDIQIENVIVEQRKAAEQIEDILYNFSAKFGHRFEVTGVVINTLPSLYKNKMITVGLQITF